MGPIWRPEAAVPTALGFASARRFAPLGFASLLRSAQLCYCYDPLLRLVRGGATSKAGPCNTFTNP